MEDIATASQIDPDQNAIQKKDTYWSRNKWNIFLIFFISLIIVGAIGFFVRNPLAKKGTPPATFITGSSYGGVWEDGTPSKLTILSVNDNKAICFYEWGDDKNGGYSTENAAIQSDGKLTWKSSNRLPQFTFSIREDGKLHGIWELNNKTMTIQMKWL